MMSVCVVPPNTRRERTKFDILYISFSFEYFTSKLKYNNIIIKITKNRIKVVDI